MTKEEALDKAIAILFYHKCHFCKSKGAVEELGEIMEVLEKMETENRWIPVSERLPQTCTMYIVTRKIYDCPDTAPIIMSDESWFDGQNTWHNDNRINHDREYLSDVIAWMPLPEPYEPQEK